MKRNRLWILAVALLCAPRIAMAEVPVWVAKIVRHVPRTGDQLAEAHRRSKDGCLHVRIGEPMQIDHFAGETQYDLVVRRGPSKEHRKLDFRYSRLGIFSHGTLLQPNDEAALPAVSRERIIKHVNGGYTSIQLRVQRDVRSGKTYLYYKPLAAVGSFARPGTQEFQALVEDSVHDVRGIGLFVPPEKDLRRLDEADLRTWVGISKDMVPDGDDTKQKPYYDLLFVRTRIDGDQIELHTFVTHDFRRELCYLQPYGEPSSREECGIVGHVFFTAYTAAKQSPSAEATRSSDVNARACLAGPIIFS